MYHDYLNNYMPSMDERMNDESQNDIDQRALIKAIVLAGFIVLAVPLCLLISIIIESL